MRVTYPILENIKRIERDHQYITTAQKTIDYNHHLQVKHRYIQDEWIAMYNKQGDMKRYMNQTTIDIFI